MANFTPGNEWEVMIWRVSGWIFIMDSQYITDEYSVAFIKYFP